LFYVQLKETLHYIIENSTYTARFFRYFRNVGLTHIVPFASCVVFTRVRAVTASGISAVSLQV